jgi:hypothetical protein
VSARKIGFLILILCFGAVVETTWSVRENRFSLGPEGCRVLGGRFYGPSFDFEETAERALSPDRDPEVEVRNAFGSVRIVPGDGPGVEIKLRKVVFQPTEEKARTFAERIELRLEEEEGRLRVGTNRDDVGRRGDVGFETHLELHVPPETLAVIRNDHGPVEASGIARAEVRNAFDDVRVERIAGPVEIDARDGRVEAAEIGAGLTLVGRHVEVELVGVEGHADLDVQHGRLTLRRAGGVAAKLSHVAVVVQDVNGDVVIEARRGAATALDVGGQVEVETSFGDIRLERIGGDVRAKVDRGAVSAEDVKGALTAEATHESVRLDRVEGRVEVAVRHGGVTARGLEKDARVRGVGEDVVIDGFHGPVDVEVERGDAHLTPRWPITEAISVSAREGGIRLEVPAGSRFELEAESRRGELDLDAPGLDVTVSDSGPPGRATGMVGGGGGTKVTLTADDDVTVTGGSPAPPAEQP